MIRNFPGFLLACFLAGCVATGEAVVSGSGRNPVDPAVVAVYLEPPARYEAVGRVTASSRSGISKDSSKAYAIDELKAQAAKIGANGVLLTGTESPPGSRLRPGGTHVQVSGEAIIVPRAQMSAEHLQKLKKYEASRQTSKSLFQAITREPAAEVTVPTPAPPAVPAAPVAPPVPGELFRVLTENAARAYESGDYISAAGLYEKALKLNRDDPEVNYNLASVYFALKKYAESKFYYQTAASLNPADPNAHLFLGYSHYYLNNMDAAAREWKKVLELDPTNADARQNLQAMGAEP